MNVVSTTRRVLLTAAAAAGLSLSALSSATPVSLVASGYAYGSENFNLSSPAINVNAGAFTGLLDGQPIIFFCFELTQYFTPGPTILSYDDTVHTGGQYTLLSELFTEAFGGLNGVQANQPFNSAAFQLAVWEILQEATPASLTTGTFQATSGDPTTIAAATALIAGLSDPGYTIHLLHNDSSQDFIYGVPSSRTITVPEPSSLLLMAIALAGMGFAMRRKSSKLA